jgi:hypothetical protein
VFVPSAKGLALLGVVSMNKEEIMSRLEQFQERNKIIANKLIRLDEQKNTIHQEITKLEAELTEEVGDISEDKLREKIESFYGELSRLLDEAEEAYKGIE